MCACVCECVRLWRGFYLPPFAPAFNTSVSLSVCMAGLVLLFREVLIHAFLAASSHSDAVCCATALASGAEPASSRQA